MNDLSERTFLTDATFWNLELTCSVFRQAGIQLPGRGCASPTWSRLEMAQAEASGFVSASSSGGEDGGGAAREAQWSGGGDGLVTVAAAIARAAEGGGTAYATAGMSAEDDSEGDPDMQRAGAVVGGEGARRGSSGATWRCGLWEQLKRSDPDSFVDFGEGELELGRVIAEGGQAQIYHALYRGRDTVAKVFKREGFSLAELQRQWPRRSKQPTHLDAIQDNPAGLGGVVFGDVMGNCSLIYWATRLEDGRFAFVMERCWGDLRTLIDLRLKDNNSQGPPFSPHQALWIMWQIARGIKELHDVGVLHRDLKAANVLIGVVKGHDPRYDDWCICKVADYESAMLVQGTGFWRAPEVLEELMKEPHDWKDDIWTEKVDAYSYAMTCYEILTGLSPFSKFEKKDWKRVIDGERPHLPDSIDPRVQDLVLKCWHKDPLRRPLFEVIMELLFEAIMEPFFEAIEWPLFDAISQFNLRLLL